MPFTLAPLEFLCYNGFRGAKRAAIASAGLLGWVQASSTNEVGFQARVTDARLTLLLEKRGSRQGRGPFVYRQVNN